MQILQQAARELLARCDGARAQDGAGYSAFDRSFGESLAGAPLPWSDRMTYSGYQMLRKYRAQLADYGIDFSEIPKPKKPATESAVRTRTQAAADRKVEYDAKADEFVFLFPYDFETKEQVKALPARSFRSKDHPKWGRKNWYAPAVPRNAEPLARVVAECGFAMSAEAREKLDALLETAPPDRTMDLVEGQVRLKFVPKQKVLGAVRRIPGRRFEKKPSPAWHVPITINTLEPLMGLVENYDFILSEDVAGAMAQYVEDMRVSVKASRADDADLDMSLLEGFGRDGMEPYPFQKAGIKYALRKKRVIIGDDMGCISGNAQVQINRAGGSKKMSLRRLYEAFNGMLNWDPSIPTYTRSMCDGEFRLNRIRAVLDQGVKRVFQITLSDGKTLTLTPDHELFTEGGNWAAVEDLDVGSRIAVNGAEACPLCGSTEDIITYQYAKFRGYCRECMYTALREKPTYNGGKTIDKDGYVRLCGHHDHPRANPAGQIYEHVYLMEQSLGRDLNWPDEQAHHINGDPADNRIENLRLVSPSEHHKLHDKRLNLDTGGGLFVPKYETIVAIEDAGTERVYDISVDGPHHNFIADGVVVHNCGKTIQALAVIHATGSYPTLVICPNSVKLNWTKEIIQWLPDSVSVSMLQGTKGEKGTTVVNVSGTPHEIPDNDFSADIIVTNYAILRFYSNQRTSDPDLPLNKIDFRCVIADEAHRLKNKDAQQSKAAAQVFRNAEYKLLLTGTPIKNRVPEYVNPLRILDLCGSKTSEFGTKWNFLNRYAQKDVGQWGTKFYGGKNLQELNTRLRGACMVRRRKSQVLKELPDLTWTDVPVEIDNRSEYDRAAEETVDYIIERAKKDPDVRSTAFKLLMQRFGGEMAGSDFDTILDRLAKAKGQKARYAIHLVRMIILRMLAARGKLSSAYRWIDDFLDDTDEKVIVFAVHRDVQKELVERYEGAAHVLGDDSSAVRQQNVDRFQTDPDCRVIICSLYAASEGITLTAASNVVFLELGWTPAEMEQAAARCILEGQPVLTTDGWVPIEDISVGDAVIGKDGRPHHVTDTWNRLARGSHAHNSKNISEISVLGWNRPLKVTADHRILTTEGWKEAKDLQPRDKICMPSAYEGTHKRALPIDEECRCSEYFETPEHAIFGDTYEAVRVKPKTVQRNANLVQLPNSVALDEDALFIFGYYMGDGFSGKSFVSFSGNKGKKLPILKRIRSWVRKLGPDSTITDYSDDEGLEMRSYSTELSNLFVKHFGRTLASKKVPEWVFGLSSEQRQWFVDGWLAADGYVRRNRNEIITAKKVLASDIVRLLMSLGHKPCLFYGKAAGAYTVGWTVGSVPHLCVQSIKHRACTKKERVYDLTVQDAESFVIGTSVVHNCHRIGQDEAVTAWRLLARQTIEEKIAAMIASKKAVFEGSADGDADQAQDVLDSLVEVVA